MATNQYTGREETDKIDFSKLTPEEQQKVSREKIKPEKQNEKSNEDIAEKAHKWFDKDRAKHIH